MLVVADIDTVLNRPWTTETFPAREDRQEGSHAFHERHVIPTAGVSIAHPGNLWLALLTLRGDGPVMPLMEMRLRIGAHIRYPDMVVCAGPLEQTTRTLTGAPAIFEVLSDDAATTGRVDRRRDDATVPSLRCRALLEQTALAATLFQREAGGA